MGEPKSDFPFGLSTEDIEIIVARTVGGHRRRGWFISSEDAADISQEVKAKMLARSPAERPIEHPDAYVANAARNAIRDLMKRRKRLKREVSLDDHVEMAGPSEEAVEDVPLGLAPESRLVFELVKKGHTNKEIYDITRPPFGRVKSLAALLRRWLKSS